MSSNPSTPITGIKPKIKSEFICLPYVITKPREDQPERKRERKRKRCVCERERERELGKLRGIKP
jgi:hypothetical protein